MKRRIEAFEDLCFYSLLAIVFGACAIMLLFVLHLAWRTNNLLAVGLLVLIVLLIGSMRSTARWR